MPKSNFDLHWTASANLAFVESKQMLANAILLVHPDPSAPLNITCNSSDFTVGGVLQQCIDNVWQPLLFFSKTLSSADTRYSAFERELLAVYATVRHFRHNLEGHLAYIAEFMTDIRYVKGETNFVAKALSRPSVSAIDCDFVINHKDLSADQALDTEFICLKHSTSSTLNFRLLKTFDDVLVWCDVST